MRKYYEICSVNLMGNEEVIPNIDPELDIDPNFLSLVKR